MTVLSLRNEIRASLPSRCCACFQSESHKAHVDLDAAVDRGYGDDPSTRVPMDDLILCEDCLRQAGAIIGMRDAREISEELKTLELALRNEKLALQRRDRRIELLEELLRDHPSGPVTVPRRRREE